MPEHFDRRHDARLCKELHGVSERHSLARTTPCGSTITGLYRQRTGTSRNDVAFAIHWVVVCWSQSGVLARYLGPALRLRDEWAGDFASMCDPRSANASAEDRAHVTGVGPAKAKARAAAIAVLRELDEKYLDSALHIAETRLEAAMAKVNERRSLTSS